MHPMESERLGGHGDGLLGGEFALQWRMILCQACPKAGRGRGVDFWQQVPAEQSN